MTNATIIKSDLEVNYDNDIAGTITGSIEIKGEKFDVALHLLFGTCLYEGEVSLIDKDVELHEITKNGKNAEDMVLKSELDAIEDIFKGLVLTSKEFNEVCDHCAIEIQSQIDIRETEQSLRVRI